MTTGNPHYKRHMVYYIRMQQNNVLLEDIKVKVVPILKQAAVKKAALFGSYVRGEQHKDSDIDMVVDLPDNATLIDLIGLQQDLEQRLQKKVDLIEYAGIKARVKDSILNSQYPIL